jgi:hypothetical protein
MDLTEPYRSREPNPVSWSPSSTSSKKGIRAPRRVGRRSPIVAAILLDALRGARTYVTRYSAGRGAE